MLRRLLVMLAALGAVLSMVAVGHAQAAPTGSADGLTVPESALERSLDCSGDLAGAGRDPVLLLSGTAVDPPDNFDWNYQPALSEAGIPWCTSTFPSANLGDIQLRGEYITYAIREMSDRAGRDVVLLGYSQGGMAARYPLKYFPDTREMVSDVIGLAPSNNGTLDANAVCNPACQPSVWQQRVKSRFLTDLNDGQDTYAGIDYTAIYTLTDEVVTPQPFSSRLPDGPGRISNIATQQVCPARQVDHLAIGTFDPVAADLVFDALENDGPTDPDRFDVAACQRAFMPGVDPATFPADFARFNAAIGRNFATEPVVFSEPPERERPATGG